MPDFASLVRARLEPLDVDPARAADIVDELAQHCAEHHAELVASGLDEAAAIERALAPLVDRVHVARAIARADRPRPVAPTPPSPAARPLVDVWRDVRYAIRLLGRTPGFTTVAVITLALGIGANSAIFSVISAVMLRPLPYADPSRLVSVGERQADGSTGNVGYLTFADWRDRARGFDQLAVIRLWSATLVADGEPERLVGMRVSANFFGMLGVAPALGRDFRQDDDHPSRWRVLILSDGLWRRRFNADPAAIGRTITMNDERYTIVGVMPRSFEPLISEHFYQRAEIWAPLGYEGTLPYACRSCQHLKALGRVKSSTTIEAARADLDAVQARMRGEHPNDYPRSTVALVPLPQELNRQVRPTILVLMGAVAFVLLIACANVANLMLARLANRERDLALRAALGASRARLVRQLLIESALVAAAGGAIGIVLAAWGVPSLTHVSPTTIARLAGAHVDARVLLFSIAISAATAVAFGLLPALRTSRVDLQAVLRTDNRKTATGPGSRARRLLVAIDVALAVVLLAGAGLMIKSVGRLLDVDPGFDPDHVLTMQISYVGAPYAEDAAVVAANNRMLDRLRALPGAESVATASQIPLGGNLDRWAVTVQGRPPVDPADVVSPERYGVTPDYFSLMKIPLLHGRTFTADDTRSSDPVIVIGERTARVVWPTSDAIGEHVRTGDGEHGPWRRVIGIVGDVRHRDLASPPTPQMYTPQAQLTDSYLTVVIRAHSDPALLASAAREAIRSVAKDVPISEVASLSSLVDRSIGPRRFVKLLLELFGLVALTMTAVGVYGVISYSVAERTREIGIRTALGASRDDIVRLILVNGSTVIVAGIAVGLALAAFATRFLESSLYGVSPVDPATLASVAALLLGVGFVAQLIPIARATRVDPSIALRQE
jgi:putative ABC transport system permease protein